MKILDIQQGTSEWHEARRGMPTSSEFSSIITTQGVISKSREKYLWRLVGERLGGVIEDGYTSYAMQRGKEKEKEAKLFYELIREPIQSVGFCISEEGYGASTDGLIGDKGVFELKCPEMATHIGYLLGDKEIPTAYYQQTQGEILVTGREYVEFMSYYPGLNPFIVREEPDPVFQKILKRELICFVQELNDLVKRLS